MLSLLMTIGRSIMWLWPFISEIFFDGKTLKQIIRTNKLIFVLFSLLVVSMFMTYTSMTTIHKIITKDTAISLPANPADKKASDNSFSKELSDVEDRLNSIYNQ